MNRYEILSDMYDCREMVNHLLDRANKDLIVFFHEIGPVTAMRYKGYHFILKYNREHFARIMLSDFNYEDSNAIDTLYELGSFASEIIGDPTLYYDADFKEDGISKMHPTLEWCLEKRNIDQYISDVVNDRLFDDGGNCVNVKLFGNRNIEDYKKGRQLFLRK